MMTYPELEIRIDQGREDEYHVELRYSSPEHEDDNFSRRRPCTLVPADFEGGRLRHDTRAYGEKLTGEVFSDTKIRESFIQMKAGSADAPLRIRLLIGDSAPALHRLRWELLNDPSEPGATLAASQRFFFSRLMVAQGWRPVKLRKYEPLQALIAVSAPVNTEEWGLKRVDFAARWNAPVPG